MKNDKEAATYVIPQVRQEWGRRDKKTNMRLNTASKLQYINEQYMVKMEEIQTRKRQKK